MDLQQQDKADQLSSDTTVESTPDSTTTTQEPKADESTPESSQQAASVSETTTEPTVPAYTPDYSYEVLEQKKELPEQVRSVIKSKEDEEYWKTVFRKADGLEHVKTRHEYTKQERDDFKNKYSDLSAKVDKFEHFAKNDLGAFFDAAKVTKEQVFDWVSHQIKLQEMSPEERLHFENAQRTVTQNYDLQQQLSRQEQFTRQLAQQQHEFGLQTALNSASDFVNEFDSRMGAGAFKQHVEEYGNTAWLMSQKYVSPQDAVNAVCTKFKPLFIQQPQASGQAPIMSQPTARPSTIPSVGKGRNVSHAATSPRSVDELRALAKSFETED